MRHIFEVHQSRSKRETGLTAPDLPRRLQECLYTPASPCPVPADQPDGPHDLLWTSVANSSQMDDTDHDSDPLLTAAGSRPSPIYTHTFFFFLLCFFAVRRKCLGANEFCEVFMCQENLKHDDVSEMCAVEIRSRALEDVFTSSVSSFFPSCTLIVFLMCVCT